MGVPSLYRKALVFAAEAHDGQFQDEGGPYILHPVRVAERVRRDGGTEVHQAVALLHDVVEDTDVSLGWVRGVFGDVIADAVDAITHRPNEPRVVYLTRCHGNPIAREVKLCDVLDNRDRPPVADPERQRRLDFKYEQALMYMSADELEPLP